MANEDDVAVPTSLAASPFEARSPDARIVIVIVGATIVFASELALTLLGASSNDELLGRNVYEFVAPSSREAAGIRHDQARAGVWPRPELITIRRIDGSERLVDLASSPVLWKGEPASQVTMWEVAAPFDRIRQQALGLRTEVADAVIVTDLDDFRIQSFNHAAKELYHWTDVEVIGCPLNEINPWIASENDRLKADKQLDSTGRCTGSCPCG